jgi:rod shape-determining protein MreC
MESLLSRYRNVTILVAVLFAQVLGLAVQVRRSPDHESGRLIRVWAVTAITPFEKAIIWMQSDSRNIWRNYLYLRGVRQENRDLKDELDHLRLEQIRLKEDAAQARRLQALLGFKEQFISRTLPAQVIGSSGSPQSRSVFIDKGSSDGIGVGMPVITSDGVVGKVWQIYKSTSQVLLLDDQTSGVGAILETSRLQGVLRGKPSGDVVLEKIMADEQVQPGEKVLTSGGDQIFPKGLAVGTVMKVSRSADSFLTIRVRPSANLSKLEEVLVITQKEDRVPTVAQSGIRAADILAMRLPSVPDKPAEDPNKPKAKTPAGTAPAPSAPNSTDLKSKPDGVSTTETGTAPSVNSKPQSGSSGAARDATRRVIPPNPTVRPKSAPSNPSTPSPERPQ